MWEVIGQRFLGGVLMVAMVLVVGDEEEGERCAAREARRAVAGEVEEADMHCSPVEGGERAGRVVWFAGTFEGEGQRFTTTT